MSQSDVFTKRARGVLINAHSEAGRFNSDYVGTEHLLLGLIGQSDGTGAKTLVSMGFSLVRIKSDIEILISPARSHAPDLVSLTERSTVVLELAIQESSQMKHFYVGTEHLLLGLLREGEGVAFSELELLGITLENTRQAVIRQLRDLRAHLMGPYFYESGKFSESSQNAFVLAQKEAHRVAQSYIGTEHLLLGILRDENGLIATVLRAKGTPLAQIRSAIDFIIGSDDADREVSVVYDTPLTPRSKKAIELAFDEVGRLSHDLIGPEHLLLGLLREGEGIAAGVLASMGFSLENLRELILDARRVASSRPITPLGY